MTTLPTVIGPDTSTLNVDEIRWSIAEPKPATPPRVVVSPPTGLTDNRADLVAWWRWRHSRLEAENSQMEDLLVRAISEAHGYRLALQAALGTLHKQGLQLDRLRGQQHQLRNEYRRFREQAMAVTE